MVQIPLCDSEKPAAVDSSAAKPWQTRRVLAVVAYTSVMLTVNSILGVGWTELMGRLVAAEVPDDDDAVQLPVENIAQELSAYPPPAPVAAPIRPSRDEVRFATFTLIRGGAHKDNYEMFLERTAALKKLLIDTPYDDIAFHEGNIPVALQGELQKSGAEGTIFVDARGYGGFQFPGEYHRGVRRIRAPKQEQNAVGYRHMCRFFSMHWYTALILFDYVMRIDEDVVVHKFQVNPFIQMEESQAVYGYALLTNETHEETVLTLDAWMRKTYKRGYDGRMYFTNVFVSRVDWWTIPQVQLFLRRVDESNSIYLHRWGDAPIQTTAVKMFADRSEILLIKTDYSHRSGQNEITLGRETKYERKPELIQETRPLRFFNDLLNNCIAPCLVANSLQLPRHPFNETDAAVKALKAYVMLEGGVQMSELVEYSSWDLAQIAQFDIAQHLGPLPSEALHGAEKLEARMGLVAGRSTKPGTKTFMAAIKKQVCVSSFKCGSLIHKLSYYSFGTT